MELIPIKEWARVDPEGITVQLANKSELGFKLGAIIRDKKGRVVAWGYNKYKTHTSLGSGYNKTLHAEMDALYTAKKLGVDVKNMTMLVFRYNNCISKPCKDCLSKLEMHGIKTVYYSDK